MKSIIVDDEKNSHEVLKRLLEAHPDIQVVASGFNVAQGVQLVRANQPELLFLDVEMPDGKGFDLLQRLEHYNFFVIFITAHDSYAIRALQFGALDYLLKPISEDDLAGALVRVRARHKAAQLTEQIMHTLESFQQLTQKKLPTRMMVSTLEGLHYIPVDDIIKLDAHVNSTEIFYEGATKRLIAAVNIGNYADQLAPYPHIMRVHRSHIVNLMKVESYNRGEAHLVLRGGVEVDVSRDNREELLRRLKEL